MRLISPFCASSRARCGPRRYRHEPDPFAKRHRRVAWVPEATFPVRRGSHENMTLQTNVMEPRTIPLLKWPRDLLQILGVTRQVTLTCCPCPVRPRWWLSWPALGVDQFRRLSHLDLEQIVLKLLASFQPLCIAVEDVGSPRGTQDSSRLRWHPGRGSRVGGAEDGFGRAAARCGTMTRRRCAKNMRPISDEHRRARSIGLRTARMTKQTRSSARCRHVMSGRGG